MGWHEKSSRKRVKGCTSRSRLNLSYFLLVVQQLVCPFAAAESPMPSSRFYSLGQETNATTSSNLPPVCTISLHTFAGGAEALILRLASIDSLKLKPNKAFQPILHFFGHMSSQPQLGFSQGLISAPSLA